MTTLRKGSRVQSGFGAYVDPRRCGTVLDSPGTVNVLVQWDGTSALGLTSVASLRNAEIPCDSCRGVRSHGSDCPVLLSTAYDGHPYAPMSIVVAGEREALCRTCGRPRVSFIHPEQPKGGASTETVRPA